MSYARTLPEEIGVRTGRAPRSSDRDTRNTSVVFFFVFLFTLLLYLRPQDLIRDLRPIPMAQITAICASLAYVVSRLSGGGRIVWTTEIKLTFALTLWFILGVPFSIWRGGSFEVLTEQWSRTLLIFLLLTQTVITASRIRKILWAMLLSQFVVACFSIALQGENAAEGERVYGATRGFLSGNFFGIAVAMTLPYLAGFAVNTRSLFKRLLLVATFLSSMVMVALTASRGGLLCVLLALALSWVMVLRGGAHARIIGVILALAMLAAVVAAPGVLLSRFSTLWEAEGFATAGGGTLGEAKSSQLQREHLLRRSIAYTFEKPLFGAGLGNFQVLSGNRTGQSGEWKGTHNTFTQVSSEAGIPAFILFVAAIVVTIRRLEHISHAPAEGAEAADLNMLARATRVSLLSFVLAGFFAHLAYDFYMFYIIAIGVAVQTAAQRLKEQPENGAPQPPAAGPDGGPLPPREKDLSKRPANGPLSRTGRDWNR